MKKKNSTCSFKWRALLCIWFVLSYPPPLCDASNRLSRAGCGALKILNSHVDFALDWCRKRYHQVEVNKTNRNETFMILWFFKLHSFQNKWKWGIPCRCLNGRYCIHSSASWSLLLFMEVSISKIHSQCLQNSVLLKTTKLYSLFLLSDELIDKGGISITWYLPSLQLKYNIYSCKYSSQLVAGFSILLLW